MKKIIASLIVTIIFLAALGITMGGRKGRSAPPIELAKAQAKQIEDGDGRPFFLENSPADGQEETQTAEHILADISEAQIDERTHDLMTAVTRLDDLCQRAVKTQGAMLSARLVNPLSDSSSGQQEPESSGE